MNGEDLVFVTEEQATSLEKLGVKVDICWVVPRTFICALREILSETAPAEKLTDVKDIAPTPDEPPILKLMAQEPPKPKRRRQQPPVRWYRFSPAGFHKYMSHKKETDTSRTLLAARTYRATLGAGEPEWVSRKRVQEILAEAGFSEKEQVWMPASVVAAKVLEGAVDIAFQNKP